ncbi:MAG: elongation factor G [Clostridiales bacterium]|jgi:elongation factor G|nr:elongation factor G [Clostridiales bacterium]
MKIYSANAIRNIAVLGHSGCGKTTLVEAALHAAGITTRMGRVDDGNTVSDYEAEEIRRKVSINAAMIPIEWLDNKINFIDTPGYFDFVGEVKEALSAADIALIVISAKSGVEVGTEKAWEYADKLRLPKIIFVNGMDDENADLDKVIEELNEKFGKSIAPLQVPFKEDGKFAGFVNAVKLEGRRLVDGKRQACEIPEHMRDYAKEIHSRLEEAVAETDDALMDKFFNEEPFTVEEIENGIRDGIKSGVVTPLFCGAAAQGTDDVLFLMNSIVMLAPPASEMRPHMSASLSGKAGSGELEVACEEDAPVSAFVFKTIADPYVGRLSIFRVYSGVLKKDLQLFNPRADATEKVSHLYVLRGKEQIEVPELRAGDIGAIAKLQNAATQDTLCAKERPVVFAPIVFPESLMSMAIVPRGKGDEDKIGQALSKLLEEDKTLRFEVDPETKQSIVSGIGDNQLDVLVNKLRTKYKLEADLLTPIVPYREMIKAKVRVQGKYKKQSGGHGQYGDVHMEFEPSNDLATPYVFEEKIFGGAVPRQYFPAVEKGIQECVKAGPLAAYPVVGIKATLVDGSYHAVDSSEMAFKMATTLAFKDGFMKAKPTLLEPIAKVCVFVPDDYTGDIMGDLNKRRGRILGMDKEDGKQKISAEAPMAEMFKYSTDLRSMTQGRGEFTMSFDRYEEAPMEVQQKVIEARKKELEKQKE